MLLVTSTTGNQGDPFSYHEGCIEANAKLSDQFRLISCSCLLEGLHERLGSRLCDRADVLFNFAGTHANTIVANRQCLRILIGSDGNRPGAVPFKQ